MGKNQFYYIAGRSKNDHKNKFYAVKHELDFSGEYAANFIDNMVSFMSLYAVIPAINKARMLPNAPFHTAILSLRTEKFTREVFGKLSSSAKIVLCVSQGPNNEHLSFLVKNKYTREPSIVEFKEKCLNGSTAEIHQVGYLVVDFESFNGMELQYSIIL